MAAKNKTMNVLAILGFCFFLIGGLSMTAYSSENVYAFKAKSIDGGEVSLETFKGKALLIVNTASRCGFTKQYKSLEALYLRYKDRGFEILAFPANNFMGQEPGTDAEIKKFCELSFGVTFPLFGKIDVKGEKIHPLYRYLTAETSFKGPITWNFNKFLVSADGRVVARFDSKQDPLSDEIVKAVENALPQS